MDDSVVAMIYLDANATTPLLPEVAEAMCAWLGGDGYANPSASYGAARVARRAIEAARDEVAALIGAQADEIVFTSGGTESINSGLRALDRLTGPGAVVSSGIEHSAVLRCLEALDRPTRQFPVTAGGYVDPGVAGSLLEGAAMVSLMAANNETGVIQAVAEIAAIARANGMPIHCDAIQAIGKIPVDVAALGVDLLSLSAHKFHGPKGVGALYVRRGLRFVPWLYGGGQEGGRRAGTENTIGIVGMGVAARCARTNLAEATRVAAMRDRFEADLAAGLDGVVFNGDPGQRLPNTSHVSFAQCDAGGLLILLDKAGIACSAGSACMTGKQEPSHVQKAMGISNELAKSSLRISFSRLNTMDEAVAAAQALIAAVKRLREVQGRGVGPVVVYSP